MEARDYCRRGLQKTKVDFLRGASEEGIGPDDRLDMQLLAVGAELGCLFFCLPLFYAPTLHPDNRARNGF